MMANALSAGFVRREALQAFTIYFDGRIPTPMKTATITYTDGRTLPRSVIGGILSLRTDRVGPAG